MFRALLILRSRAGEFVRKRKRGPRHPDPLSCPFKTIPYTSWSISHIPGGKTHIFSWQNRV